MFPYEPQLAVACSLSEHGGVFLYQPVFLILIKKIIEISAYESQKCKSGSE